MPLNLPRKPNRYPPRPEDAAGPDPGVVDPTKHASELRDYLRKVSDEQHRNHREIMAASVDKRDEITIVSNGPGVEVKAPHGMKFRPTRFQKIMGKGRVDNSRDTLADDQFVYLETSAAAGASFVVMLWSHEADNG